ncbi:MAG: response regulator transcription factor [Acidobacteriota bacterium]
MKILIADDHQVVREGVKRLLSESGDVSAIGEAENAQEVVKHLSEQKWDVLVLDLKFEGTSGLQILKEAKMIDPKLPVLIFSMYPEDQVAVQAIKSGASGYVTKSAPSHELLAAIREVSMGSMHISAALAKELAASLREGGSHAPHELLSNREYEIFELIADGKTVGEIARMLYLSVKTVSTHRTHILQKMKLSNNAELMKYYHEHIGVK